MKFNKNDSAYLDYKSAMIRFFDDEELYEQAIGLFINSPILTNLKTAYENKDYITIFKLAHELKGACGNLSLVALCKEASELTESVRNGIKNLKEFEIIYARCIEVYEQTLNSLTSV